MKCSKWICLFLAAVMILSSLVACGGEEQGEGQRKTESSSDTSLENSENTRNDDDEQYFLEEIVLVAMLPNLPSNRGKMHANTADALWVDVTDLSDKQFNDYIEECKQKGFVVDVESDNSAYRAYNAEGYSLRLRYSGDTMSVYLDAPIEMASIIWPTSMAAKLLPLPKSEIGKFIYESDDGFYVYLGDCSRAYYEEYINACSEKGFIVDYSSGEYYYAHNNDGWHITICYEGNSIMSVQIDSPSYGNNSNTDEPVSNTTDTTSDTIVDTTTQTSNTDTTENGSEKEDSDNVIVDPDFKAAMDSYEVFMDEYVAFMKKYQANPTDMGLLVDLAEYMRKYADFVEDFEQWEDEEMNSAEAALYFEVQARVSKKLLDVAG